MNALRLSNDIRSGSSCPSAPLGDDVELPGQVHEHCLIVLPEQGDEQGVEPEIEPIARDDRAALWASHYAHVTWPHAWHSDLHAFGHSHGGIPATRKSLDVGVDCWNWLPVTLGEIMARMEASPAIVSSC